MDKHRVAEADTRPVEYVRVVGCECRHIAWGASRGALSEGFVRSVFKGKIDLTCGG